MKIRGMIDSHFSHLPFLRPLSLVRLAVHTPRCWGDEKTNSHMSFFFCGIMSALIC